MDIDKTLSLLQSKFSKDSSYSFEVKKAFSKPEGNNEYSTYSVDLAVLKDNHVMMVISQATREEDVEKHLYHHNSYCHEADYYVALWNEKFICKESPYCIDCIEEIQNNYDFGDTPPYDSIEKKELNIEELVDLIRNYENSRNITSKEICEYLTAHATAHEVTIPSSLIESIDKKKFGYNNHAIWLDSATEVRLITSLLNEKNIPSSIYRYTTANTLTRIFNDEKESEPREISHSMSSLVTMNDTTEMDYANDYLQKAGVNVAELTYGRDDSVHAYITSLTDLEDDLTLWRLYSDKAQGICIEYEVPKDIQSSGFILAWVSYANDNNINPKLDFLASLMKTKLKGRRFVLRGWHGWQHFFKPKEYSVEHEIRLLAYIDNHEFNLGRYKRKWITTPDGIFAPLLLLPLKTEDRKTAYPLSIKGVKLGSKFIEKDANRITWEYKIKDEFGDYVNSNFQMSISAIDNYR